MTGDLTLLPAADETMRCADHARGVALDPVGTAIRADLLIAADVPLPWPKPVFAHDALGGVKEAMGATEVPARVLASVPRRPEQGLEVTAYERRPWGAQRQVWRTDQDGLAEVTIALIEGRRPTMGEDITDESMHVAEVWICTQGSHDLCCGSDGTRFAADVEGTWDDVVVRRVSHTGGHRFAPTAVTLPDGRMWAYLDPGGLRDVLTRSGDASTVADRCRGWWGADTGPAQVAERALLLEEGWTWEQAPRTAEVIGEADGVVTVQVTAGEDGLRTWIAEVRAGREVPTIACRAPGGLPAKPGVEWELIDFRPA
ncbi:MAG: sucrase ferredoxin [Actinomycetota bacterium]